MDAELKVLHILKKRLEDAIKSNDGDEYMCNVLNGIGNPDLEPSAVKLMGKDPVRDRWSFNVWYLVAPYTQ